MCQESGNCKRFTTTRAAAGWRLFFFTPSRLLEAVEPHLTGVYPNFIEGPEAQKVFAQAFSPEVYDRLKALKAQYDPQNRFCYGLEF